MDYGLLAKQFEALAEGEHLWLPLLSNASALLWESLDDINWAGFYLAFEDGCGGRELALGPFQGKVACMHIPWGRGVCGTSAALDTIQRVENVHEFSGHIACDSASNSEIVIPLHRAGRVWGVLDIDSPSFSRFSEQDERGLALFAAAIEAALAATR